MTGDLVLLGVGVLALWRAETSLDRCAEHRALAHAAHQLHEPDLTNDWPGRPDAVVDFDDELVAAKSALAWSCAWGALACVCLIALLVRAFT